jgi:hypothetical protein
MKHIALEGRSVTMEFKMEFKQVLLFLVIPTIIHIFHLYF